MHDHIIREYWIVLPILGMALGGFVLWLEFSRQRKALDVLRVYAEKGQEPPPSVIAVLNRASTPDKPTTPPWSRFAFYTVMAVGFGLVSSWFGQGDPRANWVFIVGFGITSFVMAANAVSALVSALSQRRADG